MEFPARLLAPVVELVVVLSPGVMLPHHTLEVIDPSGVEGESGLDPVIEWGIVEVAWCYLRELLQDRLRPRRDPSGLSRLDQGVMEVADAVRVSAPARATVVSPAPPMRTISRSSSQPQPLNGVLRTRSRGATVE